MIDIFICCLVFGCCVFFVVSFVLLVVCFIFQFVKLIVMVNMFYKLKIGFVLGGGVVCGFVYIGVIKMLELYGIVVDYVVGISVGVVVGVFYVGGYDVYVM